MRLIFFIAFCVAALWLADMVFYKSRYSNQIWLESKDEVGKAADEFRRAFRF